MANGIRLNARLKSGLITVKALISHPMTTGTLRDKKTGKMLPAHYIKEVTCMYNDEVVLKGYWGPGVSRNPYISFRIKGGSRDDVIKLSWVDNRGDTGSAEATPG